MVSTALFNAHILGRHLKRIEMLPFILVNPFDLNIKEGGGIHQDTGAAMNDAGEVPLGGQMGLLPALQEVPIILKVLQFSQLVQVLNPSLANHLVEQCSQLGVGQGQPAPGGDAIGDVGELFRPEG